MFDKKGNAPGQFPEPGKIKAKTIYNEFLSDKTKIIDPNILTDNHSILKKHLTGSEIKILYSEVILNQTKLNSPSPNDFMGDSPIQIAKVGGDPLLIECLRSNAAKKVDSPKSHSSTAKLLSQMDAVKDEQLNPTKDAALDKSTVPTAKPASYSEQDNDANKSNPTQSPSQGFSR